MKKTAGHFTFVMLFILLTTVLLGCASSAASMTPVPPATFVKGSTSEHISFDSEILKQKMSMNVCLPGGYDPKQKYAVVYLIHGFGCNESVWKYMSLATAAEKLFENATVRPYIIVTPDIDNSFGINSSETTLSSNQIDLGPYEDYVIHDVIGYIDAHYNTIKEREGRYIGGFSMGGYVALYLGMKHTDLFSKIGAHSPAAILKGDTRPNIWNFLYPTEEDKRNRNPMLLSESADLSHTAIYIDCGTEDRLSKGAESLYEKLKEKDVKAEYHAYPGGHDMGYWKSHVEEYLQFYGTD